MLARSSQRRMIRRLPRGELLEQAYRLTPATMATELSGGKWLPAAHLRHLDPILVRAAVEGDARVIVEIPVRHGKTTHVGQWLPFWYLSTFPDRRIISASHGAEFAVSAGGREIRNLVRQFGSRTGIALAPDSHRANDWQLTTGGGVFSVGIGGGVIGRGANLFVVDDPYKSWRDAYSATYRQMVWDWWRGTAISRLEPGASVVLVMSRWHHDDLAGRLIRDGEAGDGPRWQVVRLPALAEAADPLGRLEGAPLWPDRFGLAELEEIRRAVGRIVWLAQYQQRPSAEAGDVFRRVDFRYYRRQGDLLFLPGDEGGPEAAGGARERLIPGDYGARILTADLALSLKAGADYFAAGAFQLTPVNDLILLDVLRDRIEYPDQLPALEAFMSRHRVRYGLLEKVAYQAALVQSAVRRGLPVRGVEVEGDKVTRALPIAARFQEHRVFFPAEAPWLGELEDELLSFPAGAHDDQADMLSLAGNYMADRAAPRIHRLTRGRRIAPVAESGSAAPPRPRPRRSAVIRRR